MPSDGLTWSIVRSNLREAAGQLEDTLARIDRDDPPSEAELAIQLSHAYHHLNVAWNARRASPTEYRHLSEDQFARWGRYPRTMSRQRAPRRRSR